MVVGVGLVLLVALPIIVRVTLLQKYSDQWTPAKIAVAELSSPLPMLRRIIGAFIDLATVITYVGVAGVWVPTALELDDRSGAATAGFYLHLAAAWITLGLIATELGGTPGKLAVGGRVVRGASTGVKPGLGRSVLRVVMSQLTMTCCGFLFWLLPLASEERLAAHDHLLKTRVVGPVGSGSAPQTSAEQRQGKENSPGWYHAEGDPPDTIRWWDGSSWTEEPIARPKG